MSGESGRQLGPYRLMSQLAVGGMAEIYQAKTAGVGGFEKLVALKVIHPNYSEDPEFVQMLVDEAKLAVHLQHGNIVQTFDLGRVTPPGSGEQYYIAMELIDGVDLYKLLRRSSEKDLEFPFEVASFIAEQAAQGLDYAHRKRDERGRPLEIVHRDISPQNILCSFDGEVKIVDFGIAKAARRANQTAAGVIKGKYYYMSPEQAWGDPIDARTDIFSTGILLYEMIVGEMLYLEEDMDLLLDKVRKAVIAKPSTRRKNVPVQLETLVMKALAKRPQDRYQSAGEMATALGRFLRTYAPDFNRGKLATWVHTVLGDEPTDRNQPRDPKLSTAVRRAEIARDSNSLLFRLEDLKKRDEAPQANAPRRRGDQATSPVKMPDLARSFASDYEESDATIVDGTGETLMALQAASEEEGEEEADESTRPMGPSQLRQAVADDPADTDFDDDEPVDSAQILVDPPLSSLADESDPQVDSQTDRTSLERVNKKLRKPSEPKLPGVRSLPNARVAPAPAASAGLYEDESGPLTGDTPEDGDEDTSERKPTLEMRPQKVDSHEEPTAVSAGGILPAWPPPNQPISANSAAPMVPLPSGLPVLSPSPSPFSPPPQGQSGRFTTDAVVLSSEAGLFKSLQPRSSRLVLVLIGGAMLAAATVAVLTSGPSAPQKGTIEVVSSPAGAEVRIDGTTIQQPTPLVITDVDPTRIHHVLVSKKGPPLYDSWESDVKFEGETRQVRLQAILVPQVAAIEIHSAPQGAEAIVNGRIAGVTPTTVSDLSPSDEVIVELRLRGYRVARRSFAFGGKRKLDVSIPLEKAK